MIRKAGECGRGMWPGSPQGHSPAHRSVQSTRFNSLPTSALVWLRGDTLESRLIALTIQVQGGKTQRKIVDARDIGSPKGPKRN